MSEREPNATVAPQAAEASAAGLGAEPPSRSESAATFASTISQKADLFVRGGFRDDDGAWHEGPHRVELDAALDGLLEALKVAERQRDEARAALRQALVPWRECSGVATSAEWDELYTQWFNDNASDAALAEAMTDPPSRSESAA